MALVVVLLILALLSIVAAGFSSTMRTEAATTRNFTDSLRGKWLAEAAVQVAIFNLIGAPANQRWRSDGRLYRFPLNDNEVQISITDERGKIDLNAASPTVIRRFLDSLRVRPERVDAIIDAIQDWRDEDDRSRPNGAERDDYLAERRIWTPANGPFESVEDLQHVMGMDADLFRVVEPFVTVHSYSNAINLMTASREVLRSLPNADPANVQALLDRRRGNRAGLEADTGPDVDEQTLLPVENAGPVYRVRGKVELTSGAVFVRDVVVWIPSRGEAPYWVLDVKEGAFDD